MFALSGNSMFFSMTVVFGETTLAVDAGCETMTATDMITPKPNAAVAIPLNMGDSIPVSFIVGRTLRNHAGTGAERPIHLLFSFCEGQQAVDTPKTQQEARSSQPAILIFHRIHSLEAFLPGGSGPARPIRRVVDIHATGLDYPRSHAGKGRRLH
jgi:hypothetical protein